MTAVAVGIAVIVIVGAVVSYLKAEESGDTRTLIEMHPEQLEFMEKKEKEFCTGNDKGKGVRCIIDYMREAEEDHVKEILAEKPKYTEGFVPVSMYLHPPQQDWLAKRG